MALNLNVPSLSELVYALSQRKNVGDVANDVLSNYNKGQALATEQAASAVNLQDKLSDSLLKKSHAAYYNKRAELMGQDDMPVSMAVQLKLIPEAVGAALLAADPNARIPSKNLNSIVSARNQDEKTDSYRDMIDSINKRHDDEMKIREEDQRRRDDQVKLEAAKGLESTAKNAPAVPADIPLFGPAIQAGAAKLQSALPSLAPLTSDLAQPSIRKQAQKDLQAATGVRRDILGLSSPSAPLQSTGNADPLLDDPYANIPLIDDNDTDAYGRLPAGTQYRLASDKQVYTKGK